MSEIDSTSGLHMSEKPKLEQGDLKSWNALKHVVYVWHF